MAGNVRLIVESRRVTLSEWAVLSVLGRHPKHAFAIVKALEREGDFGRIWSVPTPVVYRAVNTLRDEGLISAVGEERSEAGPPRTLLRITPIGTERLRGWLDTPVGHMRDVRSELLLKLAVLDQLEISPLPLIRAQLERFEPLLNGLERQAQREPPVTFDATLAQWRLESARAVMRFLHGLAGSCV